MIKQINKLLKCKVLIVLCIFSFLTAGCGKKTQKTVAEESRKDDKIRIGVTFDSFVIERWRRDRDVFVSMAKELGAEVNVQSANGDMEEQIRQIEYFIESDMDVIVIVCIRSEGLEDAVNDAKEAGIKVIAYDRLIKNANVDLYISFDNEMVGDLMAQALIDAGLPDGGSVLMLGGDVADNNVPVIEAAFRDKMAAHNITILDSVHATGWRAEIAGEYLNQHTELLQQVDGIMCGNDNIASQVFRVLSEQRVAGSILLVGQDADLEACQRIVEGTQTMTVYKPVDKLASCAAECAVSLAKGEAITCVEVLSIHDGKYEVPYVKLEPVSVTAENMDAVIINGGFHLREDVYLNTPQ